MNSTNKETPQTGNVNPQMGEANKKMISNRLSDKDDLLTMEMVKLIFPDMKELISCCTLRSKDDTTLRNSEIAFMYEIKNSKDEIIEGEILVDSKGSMGLGSLNQLAIFWLGNILSKEELLTPAGKALTAMAGAANNGEIFQEHISPGDLMVGTNASKYGIPLQIWLGKEENLIKFLEKGLGVKPGKLGEKILMLNMRQGGLQGEDIFVMVDAGLLGKTILKECIRETSKKIKYVQIDSESKSLKFSRGINLKRIGGPIRGENSNQLQLTVKTKGILSMIVNPEKNNDLNATICLETPRPESINISALNPNYEYEIKQEFSNDLRKLLLHVEKKAIDLDQLSKTIKHKII